MKDTELRATFARELKTRMAAAQVTQRALADHLGITEAAVSTWCQGRKLPRMDKLDQICALLSCSRVDLIGAGQQEALRPALSDLLSAAQDLDDCDLKALTAQAKELRRQ